MQTTRDIIIIINYTVTALFNHIHDYALFFLVKYHTKNIMFDVCTLYAVIILGRMRCNVNKPMTMISLYFEGLYITLVCVRTTHKTFAWSAQHTRHF